MNRKLLLFIFAVEGIACLILATVGSSIGGVFPAVMAFPFEQIGLGLRTLSLSGATGNMAAIVLYVVICLVPFAILLIRKRKNILHMEDSLLGILSILLFVVMYQMINPGLISLGPGGSNNFSFAKAILGGTIYSVICAYVVLGVLRLFFSSDTEGLQKHMVILLVLVNALFIYLIFGVGINKLLGYFEALRESNAGNEHLLGASYVFLTLQFVVDNIPFILNIFVVFAGISLLYQLTSDRYSAATVSSSEKLSKICRIALMITVLTNTAFNVLQLIFSKMLFNINSSVEIPLFSIAFVLAALLLSRFVAENKALKDDNDSII